MEHAVCSGMSVPGYGLSRKLELSRSIITKYTKLFIKYWKLRPFKSIQLRKFGFVVLLHGNESTFLSVKPWCWIHSPKTFPEIILCFNAYIVFKLFQSIPRRRTKCSLRNAFLIDLIPVILFQNYSSSSNVESVTIIFISAIYFSFVRFAPNLFINIIVFIHF